MPLSRVATAYTPQVVAAMRADTLRTVRAELAGFVALAEAGDAAATHEIFIAFMAARERGDEEIAEIFAAALIALAKDPAYTGRCSIGAL